ncbi:hypothetical protein B0H13DRAFT_2326454 [Mycena leptocephala]|nr:hypothetical protein B0H13DRAFT_2326454 [Mycena leptocephala]
MSHPNSRLESPAERSRLTIGSPCALDLNGPSLLPLAEENTYKMEVACNAFKTCEAESLFVRSLLAASRATVSRHQAELKLANSWEVETRALLGCHQAEIQLVTHREIEAESRVRYYCRLSEVASSNAMDAQKQLGAVREAIFVEAGHVFADEEEKERSMIV